LAYAAAKIPEKAYPECKSKASGEKGGEEEKKISRSLSSAKGGAALHREKENKKERQLQPERIPTTVVM